MPLHKFLSFGLGYQIEPPWLSPDDLVLFLGRCAEGLNPSGGVIVIKDNVSSSDVFDSQDSSVTRCVASLLRLVERAGLVVIKEEEQENFPSSLFQVKM